jgi:hypothetical protein
MSKMDNMRAMREAKFERTTQAAARRAKPTAVREAPVVRSDAAPVSRASEAAAEVEDASSLCGHRAISGRTCTRERGHDAKSHRYS